MWWLTLCQTKLLWTGTTSAAASIRYIKVCLACIHCFRLNTLPKFLQTTYEADNLIAAVGTTTWQSFCSKG